ncbi:MAG TPA: hypothetical protein VG759_27760, partial [Candidatus Angelobacter sp.]|nr:hypothetical protein [Candidatus Angelobacter sp.]
IDGLCRIADRCSEFDQTFSRQCLKEAFDLVKWRPDRHAASMCRTIINAAHALSEEWAAALVGSMDDDSARQNARQFSGEATSKRMAKQLAQQRVNELKLREELTKEAGIPSDLSEVPTDEIADVFWESIGGLNSGRREPVSINRSRCYLKIAAAMPMQFAYPVISWAIENAKRKLKGTTQVSTIIRGMFEAATSTAELITKMVAIRRAGATRSLQPLALNIASSVVKAGERHKALEEIERWLSEDVSEYLKISDPFIGPVEASQILRMVLASAPDATVSILTSKKHQPKNTAQSLEDQYSSEWRKICDQEPPDCQITVAGLRSSGEPPVHDRWWITSRGGLRLGTSFNSIGDKKDSEIVRLTLQEAADREQQLNMYLYGLARERQGERITYTTFTLER